MPITVVRDVKREQVWARGFLMGPSGSGKSRGAFEIASRLFGGDLPIVLINTQPNQGRLYADRFKIEALIEIPPNDYHVDRFIEALDAAESIAPGGVVILDSATHEWYGTNGITQLASRFGDWAKARPLHQKFVDRLTVMRTHLIVTCRAKMKYEQVEADDGKKSVIALGIGPMQDADFQYEFTLIGVLDRAHECEFSGHVDALVNTSSLLVDEGADRVAAAYTAWLSEGEPLVLPEAAEPEAVDLLTQMLLAEGHAAELIEERFQRIRRENQGVLTAEYVTGAAKAAVERAAAKNPPPEPAADPAAGSSE